MSKKLRDVDEQVQGLFLLRVYTPEEVESEVESDECLFSLDELQTAQEEAIEKIVDSIDWEHEVPIQYGGVEGDVETEVISKSLESERLECRIRLSWSEIHTVGCKDMNIPNRLLANATINAQKGELAVLDIDRPDPEMGTHNETY